MIELLAFAVVGAFAAIAALGHVLLARAVWPEQFPQGGPPLRRADPRRNALPWLHARHAAA
jgi:hypothetical protein